MLMNDFVVEVKQTRHHCFPRELCNHSGARSFTELWLVVQERAFDCCRQRFRGVLCRPEVLRVPDDSIHRRSTNPYDRQSASLRLQRDVPKVSCTPGCTKRSAE